MGQHPWTYQALVAECFDFRLNRVVIRDGSTARQEYDLAPSDEFWVGHAFDAFPKVAEEVEAEFARYAKLEEELRERAGMSDVGAPTESSVGSSDIMSAVQSLPELTARKACLDVHMKLATRLLDSLKERGLVDLFNMEQAMTANTLLKEVQSVLTTLRKTGEGSGSLDDKLRLWMSLLLLREQISDTDLDAGAEALTQAGADATCLDYVQHVRRRRAWMDVTGKSAPMASSGESGGMFSLSDIAGRAAEASKLGGRLLKVWSRLKHKS